MYSVVFTHHLRPFSAIPTHFSGSPQCFSFSLPVPRVDVMVSAFSAFMRDHSGLSETGNANELPAAFPPHVLHLGVRHPIYYTGQNSNIFVHE